MVTASINHAPRAATILRERIEDRSARIGIVGLGYVGLPLAQAFAEREFSVLGFDHDVAKIEKLARGESYIRHIPKEMIQRLCDRSFRATNDLTHLHEPDVIIVCVPTPLTPTQEPDLAHVLTASRAIAAGLRPRQLVILESTTYPGTTRQVVQPILETGGLRAGSDFFLAFSPEREDPGNRDYSTRTIPKVVGGVDDHSLQLASTLYSHVVDRVVAVSSVEVAEAAKILENTYRAVNIALVNELKVLFDRMGIDVAEVIDAARTKPFGFQAFYPGPGLGGHCIPIDPLYLAWIARKYGMRTRLIELAGEVNDSMPNYVIDKLTDALNERGKSVRGSRVLLIGMAYKKNVDDVRESPGLIILKMLQQKGAIVNYNDPYVPRLQRKSDGLAFGMTSQELTPELLKKQDCAIIITDHSSYDWYGIVENSSLVLDTRNATQQLTENRERIIRA